MAQYEEWIKWVNNSLELAQSQRINYIQYEDLCYQSQQTVEKALKGLLIYYNI
jgi:HEPN domain-containing protein